MREEGSDHGPGRRMPEPRFGDERVRRNCKRKRKEGIIVTIGACEGKSRLLIVPILLLGFALLLWFAIVKLSGRGRPPVSRVIPGTFAWDIEANRIGSNGQTDLWWQIVNDTERYIMPENGARIAVVTDRAFESIDRAYAESLQFSDQRISSSALAPGTNLVVRTGEGHLAKVRVIRYRSSHDLDFEEAKSLPEDWKNLLLSNENWDNYHIEVEFKML
jgi:hypothetical protein